VLDRIKHRSMIGPDPARRRALARLIDPGLVTAGCDDQLTLAGPTALRRIDRRQVRHVPVGAGDDLEQDPAEVLRMPVAALDVPEDKRVIAYQHIQRATLPAVDPTAKPVIRLNPGCKLPYCRRPASHPYGGAAA
jgi:hypothetical protein